MNKAILIVFLILSFYIGFIAYSDFNKFSSNLGQFKIELLPIVLSFSFISYLIMGIRQKFLLKKLGINLKIYESILLYFSGLTMIITPGGLGEAIKSYYLKKKYGISISKTFPLVLIERFHDLVVLVSVIGITLIFLQINEVLILELIILPLIIITYLILKTRTLFKKIINFLIRIRKLEKIFGKILESYDGIFQMLESRTTIISWGIGLVSQIFYILSIYFIFLGFDIDLGIIFTTEIVYSSILYGAISLLPGGVGLTEISTVNFLMDKGIEISLATSIIIMVRMVTIWFATVIGLASTRKILKK